MIIDYQNLVVVVVVVLMIVGLVFKANKHKRTRALTYFNKAASGRNEPQFVTIYDIAKAANIRQEVALEHMQFLIFWGILVAESFPDGEKYYKKRGTISFLEYQKAVQGNIKICS